MTKGRLLDPARQGRIRQRKSKSQERRTAEDFGGKITPGSGNKWFAKGDVTNDTWLIENKTTDKESYALKFSVLKALILQATLAGRKPMLQLDLGGKQFVIITLDDAKERGLL